MSYKVYQLQNQMPYAGNPEPSIVIHISDPEWEVAYSNWKKGKNPTESPEWKMVVALTEEV